MQEAPTSIRPLLTCTDPGDQSVEGYYGRIGSVSSDKHNDAAIL